MSHGAEKKRALESVQSDLQKKWDEEKNRFGSRIKELENQIKKKDEALISAVNEARCEGDQKVRKSYGNIFVEPLVKFFTTVAYKLRRLSYFRNLPYSWNFRGDAIVTGCCGMCNYVS